MKLDSNWTRGTLADVIQSVRGGFSVQCEERRARSDEFGVLKTGAVLNGVLDVGAQKFVPEHQHHRLKTPLRKNTIILCRKNSEETIGSCALVEQDHGQLFLSDLLWEIEAKPFISTRWLCWVLQSIEVRQLIRLRATGTQASMKNISQDRLLEIPILIPSPHCQSLLVRILSSWDDAYSRLRRQIGLKRDLYAALRESLVFGLHPKGGLSQRKPSTDGMQFNVPPSWQVRKIATVARQISARNQNEQTDEVLSCSKHDGFVRSLDYFGKQVFGKDLRAYKMIWRGDFGFPSNHVEEGSLGYQDIADVALLSPIYVVFRFDAKQVQPRFAYRVLKSQLFRHFFKAGTSATVGRRGSLRWGQFSKLPFPVPPLPVQKEIIHVLDDAECEIGLLEAERTALTKQRDALATQLLTGKLRVPEALQRT